MRMPSKNAGRGTGGTINRDTYNIYTFIDKYINIKYKA